MNETFLNKTFLRWHPWIIPRITPFILDLQSLIRPWWAFLKPWSEGPRLGVPTIIVLALGHAAWWGRFPFLEFRANFRDGKTTDASIVSWRNGTWHGADRVLHASQSQSAGTVGPSPFLMEPWLFQATNGLASGCVAAVNSCVLTSIASIYICATLCLCWWLLPAQKCRAQHES